MKRVLLCILALTIGLAGYSQKKPEFKVAMKSLTAIKADRVGIESKTRRTFCRQAATFPL